MSAYVFHINGTSMFFSFFHGGQILGIRTYCLFLVAGITLAGIDFSLYLCKQTA